jgi:hypothetical protein
LVVTRGGDDAAARERALFLCREEIARDPSVQRLLNDAFAPFAVAVVVTNRRVRRGFAEQVAELDAMLADCAVAIGHGYDAWVLMAAAAARADRDVLVPQLLLINPVLGASQHLNGSLLGYRAPRGRRVRAAFGLESEDDGHPELVERTTYVFGDNDPHSSLRDWRYLRGLGCRVHGIRGWHERNRASVESQLFEVLAEYARDQAAVSAATTGDDDEPDVRRVAGGS